MTKTNNRKTNATDTRNSPTSSQDQHKQSMSRGHCLFATPWWREDWWRRLDSRSDSVTRWKAFLYARYFNKTNRSFNRSCTRTRIPRVQDGCEDFNRDIKKSSANVDPSFKPRVTQWDDVRALQVRESRSWPGVSHMVCALWDAHSGCAPCSPPDCRGDVEILHVRTRRVGTTNTDTTRITDAVLIFQTFSTGWH